MGDEVFAGMFITCFSVIGCGVIFWCVRECRNYPKMKKSTSSQELSTMNDTDPEMIV